MKFRKGFVSNSSTTSFAIYGLELETCEVFTIDRLKDLIKYDSDILPDKIESLKKAIESNKKYMEKEKDNHRMYNYYNLYEKEKEKAEKLLVIFENFDNLTEEQESDLEEALLEDDDLQELILESTPMEYWTDPYDSYVYFGTPLDCMSDDETKAQFKERVTKDLQEVFGEEIDVKYIERAWRDG